MFARNVYCLLGLPFDAVGTEAAVSLIRDSARNKLPCFFSTPNVNFVVACQTDEAFRNSVIASDLIIADGAPLIWIARLLRIPIKERVSGSGVFERLRYGERPRISVFFLGGKEGVAEAACSRLNADASGMKCVGYECPGFGSVEEMSTDEILSRINDSGADVVLVALGAAKGQEWIMRNRNRLSAPIISHLGAVIDFVAGTVRRAPFWVQQLGLEWLWRVKEEPALWRRYFFDGLALMRLLATRVVPYWWLMWRQSRSNRMRHEARLQFIEHHNEVTVQLHGVWISENLQPLHECFSNATLGDKNVRLDMLGVTYVDSAFIGLLMLLYANRMRRARRLSVENPCRDVRRIFRYSCAEFLLESRE